MMIQIPDVQYRHQIKKGDTVKYGNKTYRVQQDRKYLHIIVFEKGNRTKVSVDNLLFFEQGSMQDYIFNGWFELYPSYEEFRTFIECDLKLKT